MGDNYFDFTISTSYGKDNFERALVKGPGDLRDVAWREMVPAGSAFMACLMGLSVDGCVFDFKLYLKSNHGIQGE